MLLMFTSVIGVLEVLQHPIHKLETALAMMLLGAIQSASRARHLYALPDPHCQKALTAISHRRCRKSHRCFRNVIRNIWDPQDFFGLLMQT